MNDFKHLITDVDGDKCLWVSLHAQNNDSDLPNDSLLDELNKLFHSVGKATSLEGLILHYKQAHEPTKITENNDFSHLQERDQLIASIKKGQETFQTLEDLKIPSIVIIDGLCPSICMELALAADYCITSNRSVVKLGFPEVKLGIHPPIGSVRNSIKRMGVLSAMDYLLTGETLPAEMAVKVGLIDAAVPETELNKTASDFMKKLPGKKKTINQTLLKFFSTPSFDCAATG